METLSVALVLADPARPGPGELRLLDTLARDPRYRIAGLIAHAPAEPGWSAAVGLTFRAEAAVFGRSPTIPAPHWEQARSTVPVSPPAPAPEADVIVDFSHAPAALALAASARFGLWRLSAFAPGAGADAACRRQPETPVELTRHDGPGPGRCIARTAYDLKFLATRNAAFLREKSVQLVERELARTLRDGAPADLGPAADPAPLPSAAAMPGYAARVAAELFRRVRGRLRARLGRRPGMFCLRIGAGGPDDIDPATATEIDPPAGHYWADPFLFVRDGTPYLFYEDYDYATRRGHLGVGRLDGGRFAPLGDAMRMPHHLSYPFVFRHGDDIFLLPETHQTGRVEIWRATDFPLEWELHATALEGTGAVDTVLTEIDGQWWLFTNICRDSFGDFCSELHLFRTDGPGLGRIEPHPLNPVVIGSGSARGGGRVFRHEGRLCRWAQDNTHSSYGYGLRLMEITALTPDRYEERPLRHITPDTVPGLIGCHHADCAEGLYVIDVRKP